MAQIGLGFTLSANAQQMASGINAGVVELQKLGYAAKKTASDVGTLKTIELSRLFISSVQTVTSSFTSFVTGAASAVASVDDLSNRTGVAAATLQAYQFAADQSGVSIETFGKAIQKLLINLGEAQTGNKTAIQSFADLGLSVADLSNLSPEQTFEKVAAAIARLPNPAQQAAAAVGLFGKSGAELVPLFQEGAGYLAEMRAEAERLGVVLSQDQTTALAGLDDSIQKVAAAFKAFQARVVAELAPALVKASEDAAIFIASIDVQAVARAATGAMADLSAAFVALGKILLPLANNILPSIGGYLAFINRKALAEGIAQLSNIFLQASGAASAYATASAAATVSTQALAKSVRILLASTGLGALAVLLGVAAGALLDWAISANQSGEDVATAIKQSKAEFQSLIERTDAGTKAVRTFGVEAKAAFKLPAEITDATLIEGTIDDAVQAFKRLASESGNLAAVPEEVTVLYEELKRKIASLSDEFENAAFSQDSIAESSRKLLATITKLTDARKADADAAKKAAEDLAATARRSSEEAAKRVAELRDAGLSDNDKTRLQYVKDLAAIQQTIYDAEQQLQEARKSGDALAVAYAQERLRLTKQAAQEAVRGANKERNKRELAAAGIDDALLKPAETLASKAKELKNAFAQTKINREQFQNGLQNLAKEGIEIRKDLLAQLNRTSTEPLKVSDIRTEAGASELIRLATGRADPALEQNAKQLQKLEEIRQAIGRNLVIELG